MDEQLRASDADRARVADRLRRAQADGRITLLEFDERVAGAYAAVTYADLAPLTADLPPERSTGRTAAPSLSAPPATSAPLSVPAMRPAGCARSSRGRALAFRIEGAAWLFASLLNLLIWGLVSVAATAPVYPWWVWVAGPWGAVLLLRRLAPRRYAGR